MYSPLLVGLKQNLIRFLCDPHHDFSLVALEGSGTRDDIDAYPDARWFIQHEASFSWIEGFAMVDTRYRRCHETHLPHRCLIEELLLVRLARPALETHPLRRDGLGADDPGMVIIPDCQLYICALELELIGSGLQFFGHAPPGAFLPECFIRTARDGSDRLVVSVTLRRNLGSEALYERDRDYADNEPLQDANFVEFPSD